jgi:Amidohydrolase
MCSRGTTLLQPKQGRSTDVETCCKPTLYLLFTSKSTTVNNREDFLSAYETIYLAESPSPHRSLYILPNSALNSSRLISISKDLSASSPLLGLPKPEATYTEFLKSTLSGRPAIFETVSVTAVGWEGSHVILRNICTWNNVPVYRRMPANRQAPADSDTQRRFFGYNSPPTRSTSAVTGVARFSLGAMDPLINAVRKTPIIDHHAHNLLLPSIATQSFLSITSEARHGALRYAKSTLAHIRAVKQLAEVLGCDPSFEAVKSRIEEKRREDAWVQKCFSGIECVLFDDGLDGSNGETTYPYGWHDRLTRSRCKRLVRIEKVAEKVLEDWFRASSRDDMSTLSSVAAIRGGFSENIKVAIADPNVAGFKSVICYRTGLVIPTVADLVVSDALSLLLEENNEDRFNRLDDKCLGPYFVHLTAQLLTQSIPDGTSHSSKPLQFHTGLGDNDLSLRDSSPSYLQPFIEQYPGVPIVLLHAGYPFTKEAGYLASVYENAYMDIGEVFPMISREGQERVIKEALELCPTEKLMWSTDGHWFPETFLLAVAQAREGMESVS